MLIRLLGDFLTIRLSPFTAKLARNPTLLATVTFVMIAIAAISLVLSGTLFQGWWQAFFLALGVGLLIAGIIDVAVLTVIGALTDQRKQREAKTKDLVSLVVAAMDIAERLTEGELEAILILLDEQRTWSLVAVGAQDDLITWVANRLPLKDGRTAEDLQQPLLMSSPGLSTPILI